MDSLLMNEANPGSRPAVTVMLSFDVDGPAGSMDPERPTAASFARGEFTVPATHRILQLLHERDLPATFFVPGQTAEAYPDVVTAIRERGHEIGHHGYAHENPLTLTPDDEEQALQHGCVVLEALTGERPVGYRAPCWEHSGATTILLAQHGFRYDSSLMGHDLEPYWCRTQDIWRPKAPIAFGERLPLVELPVAWHLDDFPQFEFAMDGHTVVPGLAPASAVYETWTADLDYACAEQPGGVLVYTMHPEVIGRGHRLRMLRRFLDHCLERGDVTFGRGVDIARAWAARQNSKFGDRLPDQAYPTKVQR